MGHKDFFFCNGKTIEGVAVCNGVCDHRQWEVKGKIRAWSCKVHLNSSQAEAGRRGRCGTDRTVSCHPKDLTQERFICSALRSSNF